MGNSLAKKKNLHVTTQTLADYQMWPQNLKFDFIIDFPRDIQTRSSWLNCALRDDEAVYWVSIGHCEALAIGN